MDDPFSKRYILNTLHVMYSVNSSNLSAAI